MKLAKIILALFCFTCATFAVEDPVEIFQADVMRAKEKYRFNQADVLKKADKVIVYLLDFDGMKEHEELPDPEKWIFVSPYDTHTKILNSKAVEGEKQKKLIEALSSQIARPEHTGGAFCHYPIHGIRMYQGEKLLYEGTFCWVCGNFSFSDPLDSDWLDTTGTLQELFASIMPIPQSELDRFHQKYPGSKPNEEKK